MLRPGALITTRGKERGSDTPLLDMQCDYDALWCVGPEVRETPIHRGHCLANTPTLV